MHVAPRAREPRLVHLSLPSTSRDAREKGNARVSENLVRHKGERCHDEELVAFRVRVADEKPHGSRNFPRQMSYFHRLYGYNNSMPRWPADRLVKYPCALSFRFADRKERGGVAMGGKKGGKKTRNETTVPKQTTANEVKRPSPSGRWTAK